MTHTDNRDIVSPAHRGDVNWRDWHLLRKGNVPSKLTRVQNAEQKPAEHLQPGSGHRCEVDRIRDTEIGANPVPQLPHTKIKSNHTWRGGIKKRERKKREKAGREDGARKGWFALSCRNNSQSRKKKECACVCAPCGTKAASVFLFSQEHCCHLSALYACVQATPNTVRLPVPSTIGFSC